MPRTGDVSDIEAALLVRACRMRYLLADRSYDADLLRDDGAVRVIPGRCDRKRAIRCDKQRYAGRHLVDNALCRLKGFPPVGTRWNNLAANFLSGVVLATALLLWI